ncbi:MAG: DEAD/DEAH box helicase family protein, partial [Verrucomicrobiota bacterium]
MTTSPSDRMGLRAYQMKAADLIGAGFNDYTKQLLVAATGAGKTQIFCETVRRHQPRRSLVLCHREELIGQAVRRLESFGIPAEIEMGGSVASLHAPAVVGSVQTLMGDSRLARWPSNHFGLVVADEAHRAMSDSWQKVLRHFDGTANVLGVSAT